MKSLDSRSRTSFGRRLGMAATLLVIASEPAQAAMATFTQVVGGQSTCATFKAAEPVFAIFGAASTGLPTGGLAACGIAGGSNLQSSAGAGPLSDARSLGATPINSGFGSGTFTGSASARAEGHSVGAQAQATYTGPTDTFSVVGADAFGQFRDSFVAAPNAAHAAGTLGLTQFRINFDGALESDILSGTGAGSASLGINYQQNSGPFFNLVTARVGSSGNFITAPPPGSASNFVLTLVPGVSADLTGDASYLTVAMTFEYGKAFDFSLALLASVQPRVRTTLNADFIATAILDGMLVFETNGTPVNDFLFTSGAGISYDELGRVAPVPIPAMGWLMGAATIGLLRRRRRC